MQYSKYYIVCEGNAIQKILIPYSEDRIYRKSYKDSKLDDFEVENELGKCKKHQFISTYIENPQILKYPVSEYFKFAVVRNPWERMVSWYCYTFPTISQKVDKDHFFKKAFNQNVLPMKAYLDYNGKNQMDYVIRYENLSQQLVDVCKKIDIPFNKFEATNVSKHPHYSHFYDDKILYEIENLYREDIREFNYEFEDER